MKNQYWQGIEQLKNSPEFVKNASKEFSEKLPNDEGGTSRRDFLKMMGFSIAAVSAASCEAPVRKAIPYLNKPEVIDPGIANYYASTCVQGSEYCPVVVKTREGRPIFIEGNTMSSITEGAVSPTVVASVLSLYDTEKEKQPTKKKQKIDWKTVDAEVKQQLQAIAARGGKIRIITHSIASPSTQRALQIFQQQYPTTQVVAYDIQSSYALVAAHKNAFGIEGIPNYQFDKAKAVVSFGADFLGRWNEGSIYYAHNFEKTRKVGSNKKEMSQHFQFEATLSLTGANADYRIPTSPSKKGLALLQLYNQIAEKAGKVGIQGINTTKIAHIEKAANALWKNRGASIVVCDSNDLESQQIVIAINQMLDNYGNTIDLTAPYKYRQGDDAAMRNFVKELSQGDIDAVIFYNTDPVQNHPMGSEIKSALSKTALTIATSDKLDTTAALCTYNTPDHHYLEAWNDAEIKANHLTLCQPTLSAIFDTRQTQESLLIWAEHSVVSYRDFVMQNWQEKYFTKQDQFQDFQMFWQQTLHDGVFALQSNTDEEELEVNPIDDSIVFEASREILSSQNSHAKGTSAIFYTSGIMGEGKLINNPILQETPDPIARTCWGNFVAIPQKMYKELGFRDFETTQIPVAKITIGKASFEIPAIVQPGQAANTIAIALGYGNPIGKVSQEAGGVNVSPFLSHGRNGNVIYNASQVKVENTNKMTAFALTQTHHTIMGRETIIQETTLEEYQKNPKAGRYAPTIETYQGKKEPTDISVWDVENDGYDAAKEDKKNENWNSYLGLDSDKHTYPNHHWGMAIDLNACTGCAACIVACSLENNVPVVGKQEVINRREMHWLRIDRYYSSPEGAENYDELEKAAENPKVVFQPLMCQHCNNAPCETVCPVLATTHSSEGLNQMTYNRCVGTKYCANNCPYKVRRFNWFKYNNNDDFDYYMNDNLGKMVLNPDVTVRSRGVMEKCSFCVQRIQAGKLKAKKQKRRLRDGDIKSVCASACATGAITFGDLNDQNSSIRKLLETEVKERAYNILNEINTRPNVWYLTKVRNES